MRISKRTAILSFACAAVLLLIFLQVLLGLRSEEGVAPDGGLEGDLSGVHALSASVDTAQDRGSNRAETLLQGEATPIEYRFVDAVFGHSIQAGIVPSVGPWVVADAEGVAEVLLDEMQGPVHANYRDYQPLLLSAMDQGGLTPMTPARSCALRVVSAQGMLLSNVLVLWSSLESSTEGASVERLTGADGTASIPAAADCYASVSGAAGTPPRKVRVPVGGTVEVVLPGLGPSLLLVDSETGAPLPGVELVLSRATKRNAVVRRVTSDAEGKIILLEDRAGLLSVSLEESRRIFAPELGVGWERRHIELAFFMEDLGANLGSEILLRLPLAKRPIAITLLDRATGEAIDGPVQYKLLRDYQEQRTFPTRMNKVAVRDGALYLPDFDIADLLKYQTKFFLWPEGYRPTWTLDLQAVRDSSDGAMTFLFDASDRRSLRVINRQGVPVTTPLLIWSADGKKSFYSGPAEEGGLYGPFDWLGDELVVIQAFAGMGLGGGTSSELGRVPASDLLQDDIATLVVDLPTTTVEVHGVGGRTADIILLDCGGQPHRASSRDEETIVFSDVPIGSIFLGPPAWVTQLRRRSGYGLREAAMVVLAGEVNHFDWDERWAASEEISGRVRYPAPGPFPLYLVPAYGTAKVNVPQAPMTTWMPLSAEGRYTIPRGAPIPEALVVCSLTPDAGIAGGFAFPVLVHDTVSPGEDVELAMGELELHWDAGDWLGGIRIDWEMPRISFHHPDGKVLAGVNGQTGSDYWSSGGRHILRGLPAGDLAIRFLPPKLGWTETIQIVAGERTVAKLRGRPKKD